MSWRNYRENGVFWNNQNLIVGGKLNKRNTLGFAAFCTFIMACHLCILLNVFFAERAGINLGLITIAWRASILFGAFMDFIIFKEKLKYYHFLGLILIVSCVTLISIDHLPKSSVASAVKENSG